MVPGPFKRELQLGKVRSSAFLFGPRMTGKTTLLLSLSAKRYYDLLDSEIELPLRQSPRLLWEEIQSLPRGSLVIIDEVQRIPSLLDGVQRGIDQLHHRFILSGSSARKLKRGGANLLGGRALNLKLHPLTVREIGSAFDLKKALHYGTLPNIENFLYDQNVEEVRRLLKSYVTIYLKEEIQAEAITRNLGAFQRFLSIAAQSNAQIIEFANISRECSVPMSTVKEYYQILEDTLLGEFVWPYDRSERKKARPKFYFFDCGVVCAMQNRLMDAPTPVEQGFL
ncbi:MAG: ATP-binding protein, partial [Deltaproteobacteria bacterium]|nr:ATP-binding protein [Deltaproteobacteria bacterium]